MVLIPRSVLRTFRALIRRAGLHKHRASHEQCFVVEAHANKCEIRAASTDVAIEHFVTGDFSPAKFLLPLSALDAWDGRGNDSITFEPLSDRSVQASWSDRSVPRQAKFDVGEKAKVEFPNIPEVFTPNEPRLWQALRDGIASTDRNASRYALGCLHFRGMKGRVDATDGQHVLTNSGFQFGFTDDVLVPGNAVLGCRDLDPKESVTVGKTGEWIGFGVGPWLMMLKLPKEGRFPRVDDLIPNHSYAPSRLELSNTDAAFLTDVIDRLPNDDLSHGPITIDLNGKVLIRSRDAKESRPTEVELTSSRLTGDPVLFSTNRCYIERALRLGFREAYIYGPKSPMLCCDDRRQFLWALLDSSLIIPRNDDAIHIDSSHPTSLRSQTHKPPETTMATTDPTPTATATTETAKPVQRTKRPKRTSTVGPIEQAITLRDALRNAASAAHQLVRTLKQHKRQSRIVESTLASLKQLQKSAG